jgi:hypothetical protein
MRKILKFSVLLLAAGLVLGLVGCPVEDDGKDDGGSVSFKSFSPRSIWVENKTGERLVAFKGSLNPNTLIGGIPANATNHGLEKKASLFSQTGDFALILITEGEYKKNKSNIASAPIFAQIYAFYNNEADNNNVFQISSRAGGAGRITLNNPTSWNIEIRRDGPTGEVLGYVASQMLNTTLRLEIPDDYDLFPVFKRYKPSDKEIYEIVPKYTTGNPLLIGKPYMESFPLDDKVQSWNFNSLASMLNFAVSSGGFYLRIQNDSGTGIRFARGNEDLITSTGLRGIQRTYTNLYNIKVIRNPDGTYPETQKVSGYSIGTTQLMEPIPEFEYKTDYIYSIRVTGDTAATLVIGDIQEIGKMDLESVFSN